jgi:ligand-binding SRPBCC domain-containing protein
VHTFEISTDLSASPDAVWQRVTTPDGINDELLPLMRMTIPRALRSATVADVTVGERLGRCWMLLFSVIPVDFDDLTIAELGPGRRFLERSTMLTQSAWTHERTVESSNSGSRVTDRLTWQGRNAVFGGMYKVAVPILFRNRHRKLRRHFGAQL